MKLATQKFGAAALGLAILLSACGKENIRQAANSSLHFIKSDKPNRAYLEARDLEDSFLFHVTVRNAPSFHKGAISYGSPVLVTKLKLAKAADGLRLLVLAKDQDEPVMSFRATQTKDGRYEVDFASPGNELSMGPSQIVDGIEVENSQDKMWATTGNSSVERISQDADTIVADVQQEATTLRRGAGDEAVPGETQGLVSVRIFLRRASMTPKISGPILTVGEGLKRNIGFFAADWESLARTEQADQSAYQAAVAASPIARIALPASGTLTIYLKDFPPAYLAIAKEAVLSWNAALGREVLRPEVAPDAVDFGDPRYHVIKWLADMDETVKWAGVAKSIHDPRTGAVLNANILVNGNFNINRYREYYAASKSISKGADALSGRMGNLSLHGSEGESPVVPFLTDLATEKFEDYMLGYYRETITHELGHALGLRHNFAGSTELDPVSHFSASIMDYGPRPLRARGGKPGSYDIAAIRWAYLGVEPVKNLPFCTDENLSENVFCNQGDDGDPFAYVTSGLANSLELLSARPTENKKLFKDTLAGLMKNALKFRRLSAQIPDDRRDAVLQNVEQVLESIRTAKPAKGLSMSEKTLVDSNLKELRQALGQAEKDELKLSSAH